MRQLNSHICQEMSAKLLMKDISMNSLLLPDADPRVLEMLSSLQASALGIDELKESLATGKSWPKCFQKHQAARKYLEKMFKKKAGPGQSSGPETLHGLWFRTFCLLPW